MADERKGGPRKRTASRGRPQSDRGDAKGRAATPPGSRALRATSRGLIDKPEILQQVSPGFYYQRCLPIWDRDLRGIVKEGKAAAVAALDRHGMSNGVRVLGDPTLCRALVQRSVHAYNMLRERIEGVELRLRNLSPFVTGIGQPHPLENGFAFLKPYGVPYLAGSGVKGAVRAACKCAWEEDKKVTAEECRKRLLHYFGSEDKEAPLSDRNPHARGALVFMDLWPEVDSWEDAFRLDIVNPHYGPYYQGNAVPADWHSPVPSFFLTLRSGIKWRLRVLYAPGDTTKRRTDWTFEVMPGVAAALTVEGLGAKKSWGYGLFRIERAIPDVSPWREMGEHDQFPQNEPAQRLQEEQKPQAVGPPIGHERSQQASAVDARIKSLKAHEVRPHLQRIASQIGECRPEERGDLVRLLRERLQQLGFKGKEIEDLFARYPELQLGDKT